MGVSVCVYKIIKIDIGPKSTDSGPVGNLRRGFIFLINKSNQSVFVVVGGVGVASSNKLGRVIELGSLCRLTLYVYHQIPIAMLAFQEL